MSLLGLFHSYAILAGFQQFLRFLNNQEVFFSVFGSVAGISTWGKSLTYPK